MIAKLIKWIVVACLAGVVGVFFYGEYRVKSAVDSFANVYADVASIQIESVELNWFGGVTLKNVVVAPHSHEGLFQISNVEFIAENPYQILALAQSLSFGRIPNKLRVNLNGFSSRLNNLALESLYTSVGGNIVSEMTSLGCSGGNAKTGPGLVGLGYAQLDGDTRIHFDRDAEEGFFSLIVDVDANVLDSKINIAGQLGVENIYFRQVPNLQPQWEKVYWWINAKSYLDRKLNYCAKQLGMNKTRFVDRHVAFLNSWLRRETLQVSANLIDGYKAFLLNGGDLQVLGKFEKAVDLEELKTYDFNETMAWLAPQVWVNQKEIAPVEIKSTDPKRFLVKPKDQPKEITPQQYRLTLIDNLASYLRWPVKIKLKNGQMLEGTLDDITGQNIALDRRIGEGNYAMYVPIINIEAIWVYR